MLDVLIGRRSIRKFEAKKVEKDKVEMIVKSALLSPSSRNICPWEFIIIDDEEIIEKLALSKESASGFLENAPLAIAVIADEEKSDVWVEDTSIASIIIQLEAQSIGLGSCWVQIRNRNKDNEQTSEDYVRNILNIPKKYRVESIIAIGYADEDKKPHDLDKLMYDKTHKNKY